MADDTAPDSPLQAAVGAAGPQTTEAFSMLANETRLSILLALWEAYEPFEEENSVPVSALRDRVGIHDTGRFNDHLDKLTGHFIRKTDEGYKLRGVGHQLVRMVIAGIGIGGRLTLDTIEIDSECFLCEAPLAITHQDGRLFLVCTECEGEWEGDDNQPRGTLGFDDFPPTGLIDRTPEEAWNAMGKSMRRRALSGVEGVCDVCSGPMENSLSICENHASEGMCDKCGRVWPVTARQRCPVCKKHERGPPYYFVTMHPAVIGFFNERGVTLQYESDSNEVNLGETVEQKLASEDPPRVQVTFEYEGDRLALLVDEELNVLEVTEAA